MLRYHRLYRHPIDEIVHRLRSIVLASLIWLVPFSVELRCFLLVAIETLLNLIKFLFRSPDEARQQIETMISSFQEAYQEEAEMVAIITGATSGIGKEMAKAVSKAGFRLVLPVRNRAKGEKVVDEIVSYSNNDKITLMDCDLSSIKSVKEFTEQFALTFNRLHLLINNAGVFIKEERLTIDGMEPNMEINFVSHFIMTEGLLPLMKEGKGAYGARIINITSASFYAGTDMFVMAYIYC